MNNHSTDLDLAGSTEQNPTEMSRGRGRGDHSPRQLWLVIVVNGAVVVIALIIGSMCCRGGSPAIYRTRYDSLGLPGTAFDITTEHAFIRRQEELVFIE